MVLLESYFVGVELPVGDIYVEVGRRLFRANVVITCGDFFGSVFANVSTHV